MVATTQLRLALETEDIRRARGIFVMSDNPIYIPNNIYLILIVEVSSLIKLTEQFIFLEQFIIYNACMYYVCYKYSVDMYLLCMIKARVRWCTCSPWRMF